MTEIVLKVLIFIINIMYIMTRAQERETLHDSENEPPPTYSLTYPIDDDDSGGEICDPSKQQACESPMAKCEWIPQDTLYKCIQPSHENKRSHRKRLVPRKEQNVTQIPELDDDKKIGQSTQAPTSQAPILRDNRSLSQLHFPKRRREKYSQVILRFLRNLGDASGDRTEKEGTTDIPKYSGQMTWDGNEDNSEECITKTAMADALQAEKTLESKEEWIEENKEQICNFKRFFHCTVEKPDLELDIQGDDDDDNSLDLGDGTPTCRCYESSMPIVNKRCYIPADFGEKSSCGDHIIAPYPIKPWHGAPLLKPKCPPNSDCKESQYWFGRRCTCRYNAKWNSQTHACDNATKATTTTALLLALFLTRVIDGHFILNFFFGHNNE